MEVGIKSWQRTLKPHRRYLPSRHEAIMLVFNIYRPPDDTYAAIESETAEAGDTRTFMDSSVPLVSRACHLVEGFSSSFGIWLVGPASVGMAGGG